MASSAPIATLVAAESEITPIAAFRPRAWCPSSPSQTANPGAIGAASKR
jgi:hypothetical protein